MDGESDNLGLPGQGEVKKRKNRPGQGRKKADRTLFKEADEIYRKAHPEAAKEIVRRALAQPVKAVCPACKCEFEVSAGPGDKELLQHIDNRVLGKPKAVQEIDLNAKLDLPNAELVNLSHTVLTIINQYQALPTEALEAQIKMLAQPDTATTGQAETPPS